MRDSRSAGTSGSTASEARLTCSLATFSSTSPTSSEVGERVPRSPAVWASIVPCACRAPSASGHNKAGSAGSSRAGPPLAAGFRGRAYPPQPPVRVLQRPAAGSRPERAGAVAELAEGLRGEPAGDVQEQVEARRRGEGPVVGEAEALAFPGPEDQGRPGRPDRIRKTGVVVETAGQRELESRRESPSSTAGRRPIRRCRRRRRRSRRSSRTTPAGSRSSPRRR